MSSLKEKLQSVDHWVEQFRITLATGAGWLPLTFAVGLSVGFIIFFAIHPDLVPLFTKEEIPDNVRFSMMIWTVASVFGVFLIYTETHRRLRSDSQVALSIYARRLNRFAVAIALIPLFLFLRTEGLGKEHPFVSVVGSLGMGFLAAYVTYHVASLKRWPLLDGNRFKRVALTVVILLAVAYMLALIHLQTRHHHSLGTRDWDFGLYINSLWHSLRGNFLGCSFIAEGTHINRHFDPILVLISPILLIQNKAESLIVFQAAWIATGAIPLYLLGKEKMGDPLYGIVLSLVYLLHPAVHGPNMYDFHSIVLAYPVLLWCMYCLEAERLKAYYGFLALLLLIREDTPALAGIMALYLILSRKLYRVAAVTILVSAVYGLFVNAVIMADSRSYQDYFEGVRITGYSPAVSIVISLFTNPGFLLRYALEEVRVAYILKVLSPLLLLPFFSKRHHVFFVWGLFTTFFSSWNGFVKLGTQYAVYWLPFLMTAIPVAVDNIRNGRLARAFGVDSVRLKPALMVGVLLSSVAMSSLYGVFWPNTAFRPGYETFHRVTTPEIAARYETVKKIQAMVPDDASVLATRRVAAHFSLREKVWSFAKRQKKDQIPDYVIVWMKDLKRKRDLHIQKGKLQAEYANNSDYELVLEENDIRMYRRLSTTEPPATN